MLEHCRKELPTWVDFIRLMTYNVPLDACAEICRVTHQTAFEWRHRVLVHDKEKAHNALVRETKCKSETYKADVRDPEYLERMSMVNSLCSWLKRYIWRFTGMDPKNLQSYLNWFVYLLRVRQAEEKWPKTERVVRHMLMSETSYRSST